MPLIEPASGHPKERELEAISTIIYRYSYHLCYVLQDLNKGKIFKRRTGARGMSAEQVLRAAVVMRIFEFTYEKDAISIDTVLVDCVKSYFQN